MLLQLSSLGLICGGIFEVLVRCWQQTGQSHIYHCLSVDWLILASNPICSSWPDSSFSRGSYGFVVAGRPRRVFRHIIIHTLYFSLPDTCAHNIVAYLPHARTVEPQKQPLLGNTRMKQ
jgi:hypothetical protein